VRLMRPLVLLAVLLLFACDDMANQHKRMPYESYSDEANAPRQEPAGTVARDWTPPPTPPPVTEVLLTRGQQRFEIYCAVCHGPAGYGDGQIVQRGFPAPPSYHIDRLRNVPVQHFYDVITSGYGAMFSYAQRVSPHDRWAIAAYIRALQASQNVAAASLTAQQRDQLR
jgi:mono/diheme cytochrome c family protein